MKENQIKQRKNAKGLSEQEALASRAAHGANLLTKTRGKSIVRRFLSNLNDPVIRILLAALVINLFLLSKGGNLIETLGIGVAVFLATLISTVISSTSGIRAKASFTALPSATSQQIAVAPVFSETCFAASCSFS